MTGIKRMPPLFLILALTFILIGCAQEEPVQQGEELTQEEIEQLPEEALEAPEMDIN